jgi:hypothetical protein
MVEFHLSSAACTVELPRQLHNELQKENLISLKSLARQPGAACALEQPPPNEGKSHPVQLLVRSLKQTLVNQTRVAHGPRSRRCPDTVSLVTITTICFFRSDKKR